MALTIGGLSALLAFGCALDGDLSEQDEPDVMEPGIDEVDDTTYQAIGDRDPVGVADPLPLEVVATPTLYIIYQGTTHVPVANVQVLDAQGEPIPNARVTGSFLGDITGEAVGFTSSSGIFEAKAPGFEGHMSYSFRVDAVDVLRGDFWVSTSMESLVAQPHSCSHGNPSE